MGRQTTPLVEVATMILELAADALRNGQTIDIKPRGRSMEPRIHDGQIVTLEPVDPATVKRGDVVLARVNSKLYLHLVTATEPKRVQISSNKGRVNGWTPRSKVYGHVVRAPHPARTTKR